MSNFEQPSLTDEQQAAAFLRERYLQLIASFPADKLCKINMHNGTEVYASIRAFDSSSDNILVDNLQPPLQKIIPHACLRISDIVSISYDD